MSETPAPEGLDRFVCSQSPGYAETQVRSAFTNAVPLRTIVIYCYDPAAAAIPFELAKLWPDEITNCGTSSFTPQRLLDAYRTEQGTVLFGIRRVARHGRHLRLRLHIDAEQFIGGSNRPYGVVSGARSSLASIRTSPPTPPPRRIRPPSRSPNTGD